MDNLLVKKENEIEKLAMTGDKFVSLATRLAVHLQRKV